MSNLIKSKPSGIDKPIQRLQSFLYPQVKTLWGVTDDSYNSYGRVYKNETADGFNPEAFVKNNDYKELFADDNLKALSFFGVADSQKYNNGSTTIPVHLIYMCNLKKIQKGNPLFNSVSWRSDEEVRLDVQNLCGSDRYGFKLVGFETNNDAVFKEYAGMRKSLGIQFKDQQPWFVFRLNFILLYNATNDMNC